MREQTTGQASTSRPIWETLEVFAREKMPRWLQRLLEEEVTELLGREKSARLAPVETPAGSRNGDGKPRRVTLSSGTVTVRRPRVRGLAERFNSRVLPLFKRRSEEVGRLRPELSRHGLAEGDVDLALRGLLGEGAPRSASTVARLTAVWHAEYETWGLRSLADLEPVYRWVDGIYVQAGLEPEKAAMLVVIAGLRDGRKVVLAVESGARESTASWSAILRDLKPRGLRSPRVVIGDGHLGRVGECLADRGGTTLLESPRAERPRHVAEEGPGTREGAVGEDSVCGDARGGSTAHARLRELVREARAS